MSRQSFIQEYAMLGLDTDLAGTNQVQATLWAIVGLIYILGNKDIFLEICSYDLHHNWFDECMLSTWSSLQRAINRFRYQMPTTSNIYQPRSFK